MENKEVDLRPYFAAVSRNKLWIFLFGLLVAAGVVGYFYRATPVYEADATLILPLPTDMSGDSGSGLASVLTGGPDTLSILKGVIESKTVTDYLRAKTKLTKKQIQDNLIVSVNKGTNQISLAYTDSSKAVARDAVVKTIDALQYTTSETTKGMANRQAANLDKAIADRTKDLHDAEEQLAAFVRRAKTAPDPGNPYSSDYGKRLKEVEFQLGSNNARIAAAGQTAKDIALNAASLPTSVGGEWRDRLLQLQYQYDTLRTQLGERAPNVVAVKRQIEVTKAHLQDEISKYLQSVQKNVDPDLSRLVVENVVLTYSRDYLRSMAAAAPEEALEIQRLVREVQIRGTVLQNLRAEYEKTKADIAIDRTIKWAVLDDPYVQDLPVNKRYPRYAIASLIGGMFIGVIFVMLRESKKLRVQSTPSGSTISGTLAEA